MSGGAIDLRNRVTGARIAVTGEDPFTYKWKSDDDPRYCDLYNASRVPVSKTTVTPLALALHAPLNGLNYRAWQWFWLLAQFGCLAGGLLFWLAGARSEDRMPGILLTLAVCSTTYWQLHVDRGQIYSLYALLFLAVCWAGSQEHPRWGVFGCIMGAVLIGMRPIFIGLAFVTPFRKGWRGLAGMGFAGLAAWAVTAALFGPAIWVNYLKGMSLHEQIYIHRMQFGHSPNAYPVVVEGIPLDTLGRFARIPFADSSIYRTLSFDLPAKWLLLCWLVWMLATAVLAVRRASPCRKKLDYLVACWAVAGDFVLPAFRNSYNDILVWPLLLLGLGALPGKARTFWIVAACGWFLAQSAVRFLPSWYIRYPSFAGFLLAVVGGSWLALQQYSSRDLRKGYPA